MSSGCLRSWGLWQGPALALTIRAVEELFRCPYAVSDTDALDLPLHHLDEEEADLAAAIGPLLDVGGDRRVYGDPHSLAPLLVRDVRRVVGDEVGGVFVSVDGEQPGGCQPVAYPGAVEASFHHVDEDAGDVVAVVGVFSDVLG